MKRSIYIVKSYDNSVNKSYQNYKSAYKFASKLISDDINCGIYTYGDSEVLTCIIGC